MAAVGQDQLPVSLEEVIFVSARLVISPSVSKHKLGQQTGKHPRYTQISVQFCLTFYSS